MELRKKVMGAGVKVKKIMSVEIIHFCSFRLLKDLSYKTKQAKMKRMKNMNATYAMQTFMFLW